MAKNAVAKFDAALSKKYADKLADFSEEEYRQLAALKDLFEFLDDIVPLDEGEEIEVPKTRSRKRYVLFTGIFRLASMLLAHVSSFVLNWMSVTLDMGTSNDLQALTEHGD